MKFLCPNCKAKYQISDEKIAGRTLKMDCRRCNHAIVIRGDKLAGGGGGGEKAPAASERRPSGRASGAHASANLRRPGSHVGPAPAARSSRSALGADFRRNAGAAAAPARPNALDQWHVAINDVPVGPMKRDEIGNKIQTGAITGESLCWREGLDDWRPLRDIAELAALLRRAQPPKAPPKPAFPSPSRALGRPPSPTRPARPPTGRTATASPRPQEPSRPAARGNVVPIGGRLGAAAAPALDELDSYGNQDFLDDDEPTRVGSTVDFEKLAEESPAPGQQASGQQNRLSPPTAQAPAAEPAGEDDFDPFASQRASAPVPAGAFGPGPQAPTPAPSAPGSFAAPPDAPPADLGSSPGAASAPGVPGALGAGPSPQAAAAPSYDQPGYAEPAPRRKGLPIGAWIAIAGAMAFGVALAVMVGTHLLTQRPDPVATTQPSVTEGATPQDPTEATPDLDVLEEPPVEVPEEPPDGPAAEGVEQGGDGAETGSAPTAGGGSERPSAPRRGTTTTPQPSRPSQEVDEATAARLARFSDDSTPGAQLDVRARNPLDEAGGGGGGGPALTGDQITAVVRRERSGVQRCWQTALRQVGRATNTRIDVLVTIGGSGTVMRATARGRGIGNLTECIESNVRRWRFPRSGGETQTSIPFVFQGTE